MLSETEAEALAEHLDTFRRQHSHHDAALTTVVADYERLLADYRSLLSDHEETRDARDRYKRQIRSVSARHEVHYDVQLTTLTGRASVRASPDRWRCVPIR